MVERALNWEMADLDSGPSFATNWLYNLGK